MGKTGHFACASSSFTSVPGTKMAPADNILASNPDYLQASRDRPISPIKTAVEDVSKHNTFITNFFNRAAHPPVNFSLSRPPLASFSAQDNSNDDVMEVKSIFKRSLGGVRPKPWSTERHKTMNLVLNRQIYQAPVLDTLKTELHARLAHVRASRLKLQPASTSSGQPLGLPASQVPRSRFVFQRDEDHLHQSLEHKGIFRRSSALIKPRQPLSREEHIDYGLESEEEFEEGAGESIISEEREAEEEDEAEEDDGFVVPDGYFSDEEVEMSQSSRDRGVRTDRTRLNVAGDTVGISLSQRERKKKVKFGQLRVVSLVGRQQNTDAHKEELALQLAAVSFTGSFPISLDALDPDCFKVSDSVMRELVRETHLTSKRQQAVDNLCAR